MKKWGGLHVRSGRVKWLEKTQNINRHAAVSYKNSSDDEFWERLSRCVETDWTVLTRVTFCSGILVGPFVNMPFKTGAKINAVAFACVSPGHMTHVLWAVNTVSAFPAAVWAFCSVFNTLNRQHFLKKKNYLKLKLFNKTFIFLKRKLNLSNQFLLLETKSWVTTAKSFYFLENSGILGSFFFNAHRCVRQELTNIFKLYLHLNQKGWQQQV